MKFDMGILLHGGKVYSWDSTPYPPPPRIRCALKGVRSASAASTVKVGENFVKQKL